MNVSDRPVGHELFTPAKAQAELDAAGSVIDSGDMRQRKISNRIVACYARMMQMGLWEHSATMIMIGQNGVCMDGQHRLMAVVKSDIPQWFVVQRNVPLSIMAALDNGARRTGGQVLHILRGTEHAETVKCVAMTVATWSQRKIARGYAIGNAEIVAFVDNNPDIITAALDCEQYTKTPVRLRKGAAGWFLFVTRRAGYDVTDFLNMVCRNEGLHPGMPEHATNQALFRMFNMSIGEQDRPTTQSLILVKGWNATRAQGKLRMLCVPYVKHENRLTADWQTYFDMYANVMEKEA